jgi:hypothetical protein
VSLVGLSTVLDTPPIPPITTREELIDALGHAAAIEHAIMCQYLYAAFSLNRTAPSLSPAELETVRGFAISTLMIARQEMEHLGLVTNLLIAVGASPNFDRPNLPVQPNYYQIDLPLTLQPFGDKFLALAELLETPCTEPEPHPALPYYPSVAAIYDRLRHGFERLGAPDAETAATLFLGAGDPQLANADFGAGPAQVWYDIRLLPVTDLTSALAAIDLIRLQGEGTTRTDPNSHYAIVGRMQAEWSRLSPEVRAAMVLPVPANPLTAPRGDVNPAATVCVFRDPRAVELARLANRCYELLLLLLLRLYGASDATDADRAMYRTYAFFPFMTCVVRPVGEILVDLPAGDGVHCAATTFELDGPIRAYRDRDSFHVQLGERLSHLATGFAAIAARPHVPERLGFVAKNVAYVRDRVLAYVAANPTARS